MPNCRRARTLATDPRERPWHRDGSGHRGVQLFRLAYGRAPDRVRREVRTSPSSGSRASLRRRVQAAPYRFDDSTRAGAKSRRDHHSLQHVLGQIRARRDDLANAVGNSRALFEAARRAGVARIVHLSIANPSIDSPLPYYRGKALVEQALAAGDVPYAIVRPTWIFGGGRRRPGQQHRMDPAAYAGLRHPGRWPLPRAADPRRRPRAHLSASRAWSQRCMRTRPGLTRCRSTSLVRAVRHALGRRMPILARLAYRHGSPSARAWFRRTRRSPHR